MIIERGRTMEQAKLNEILDEHKKWLKTEGVEGQRANLRYADLRKADLSSADLRKSDLSYADLCDANLSIADLRYADLSYTDLRNADLRNADLDFTSFPLWCGGLDVNIDDKQATQLLYHLIRNVNYSKNTSKSFKKICGIKSLVKQANKFHRVGECGIIEEDANNAGGLNE